MDLVFFKRISSVAAQGLKPPVRFSVFLPTVPVLSVASVSALAKNGKPLDNWKHVDNLS